MSAPVKRFLVDLASGEIGFERMRRSEQAIRESIVDFDASDRLSRDEGHDRSR